MGLDRRTALTGLLALTGLAATGCGLLSPEPPPPHPLTGLLVETKQLLAQYDAVIAAYPNLRDLLAPFRENHAAHLRELDRLVVPRPSGSPSVTPSAAAPASEEAALEEIRMAEKAAQESAMRACLSAKPEYAELTGAIAACRATHQEELS